VSASIEYPKVPVGSSMNYTFQQITLLFVIPWTYKSQSV
jgi:hypothetical protein